MTAIKRRLLIAATTALALICSAGELSVQPDAFASGTAGAYDASSTAWSDQQPSTPAYEPQFATVTHPSQDAWAAMLRASSR